MNDGRQNPNVPTGPWHPEWMAAFPAGVRVQRPESNLLLLHAGEAQFRLRGVEPSLADLLARLDSPGISIRELVESALALHVGNAVSRLFHHLATILAEGFLNITVTNGGERIATLSAVSSGFRLPLQPVASGDWVLSRFASLRRGIEGMVAESPRSLALLTLHAPSSVLGVQSFSAPCSVESWARTVPGLSKESAASLFALLHAAELLTACDEDGVSREDADPDLVCWEAQDLQYHVHSRRARFDSPFGAVFAVADQVPQPVAVKPARGAVTSLPCPDLDAIEKRDPSLTQAIEQRKSIREFGRTPLSVGELGEFLYRVARIRERRSMQWETPNGVVELEFLSRPFPAGGSLHELEIYAVVQRCAGLTPGVYRYEPLSHGLEAVAPPSEDTQAILEDAGQAAGVLLEQIQLTFVITARFPRIAWKYSGFAYALVLKHVGVLFQTMYLVATAMNLAPCALGAGNPDRFARLTSENSFAETSVGEFLLGSRE